MNVGTFKFIDMKGKYLITCDHWFVAKDGLLYNAVWGEVEVIEDNFLGVKTNRNSSNWFAKIGTKENHMIVAGCQIHYAMKCEEQPNNEPVKDYHTDATNGCKEFTRPTRIWVVV